MLKKLTTREKGIIFSCLRCILEGDDIEDPEFHTRLGAGRDELRKILNQWPHVDDSEDNSAACLLINNCINEICNGIWFSKEKWDKWFSVDRDQVRAVFAQWARQRGWKRTGLT